MQLTEIERADHLPHAVVISGLRWVGKSMLLAHLAHRMGETQFYYVNFEGDRFLGFRANDVNDLYRALLELFGLCKVSNRFLDYYEQVGDVPGMAMH